MKNSRRFRIRQKGDKNGEIQLIISLLKYARQKTIKAVDSLTIAHLDHVPDNYNNNIGALLKHICFMDRYTQTVCFEGVPFTAEELNFWDGARGGTMQPPRAYGMPLVYYLELMRKLREQTIAGLNKCSDVWLREETALVFSPAVGNLYVLMHLLEEEIGHCYQINMIKTRLKEIQSPFNI